MVFLLEELSLVGTTSDGGELESRCYGMSDKTLKYRSSDITWDVERWPSMHCT